MRIEMTASGQKAVNHNKARGRDVRRSATSVGVAVVCTGLFALACQVQAAVSVTGARGGGSISADTSANVTSPAWTSLGAITLAESANGEFGAGTNVTLVLKAPA